ncbi:MAG: hypothetical protein IT269_00065, partial [Saprospiraceae bacterium]|nr:hypothetical protein [Saprospiraceae bacterium]
DLAQNGNWGESRLIGAVPGNIKLRATKLNYTPFDVQWGDQTFRLKMIFVRPNDQVVRPCVILSPGNGSDFNNWYNYLALGVADYVSRGYAVAFYENFNNIYFNNAVLANPAASTNLPVFQDPELPFYALYQFANAAGHFVGANAGALKVNPEQLFSGGNSAGGFAAYSLALADDDNFSHPVFSALGNHTNKVWPSAVATDVHIKGIGIIGSGLFLPEAKMGDLIDSDDDLLTSVLWHGSQDPLIYMECCDNSPCNGDNGLAICGALSVGERLCEAGMPNEVNIICEGGHRAIVPLLNTGQTNNPPTAGVVLGPLHRELQQMMDIQKAFARQFSTVINQQPVTGCSVSGFKPKNYPNTLGTNWFLAASSSCVSNAGGSQVNIENMEKTVKPAVRVSPNPVADYLQFSWTSAEATSTRWIITDNNGSVRYDQVISGLTGDNYLKINEVKNWVPGLYYWTMLQDNGTTERGILVINK